MNVGTTIKSDAYLDNLQGNTSMSVSLTAWTEGTYLANPVVIDNVVSHVDVNIAFDFILALPARDFLPGYSMFETTLDIDTGEGLHIRSFYKKVIDLHTLSRYPTVRRQCFASASHQAGTCGLGA